MLKLENQIVHFSSSEDMTEVTNESVDFFVTSPPYWNLKNYGTSDQIGASDYEEYLTRMGKVWEQCYLKARQNSILVININNRRHQKRYYPIAFDIVNRMESWALWDVLIWYIPNALPQAKHYMERLFDNKFEYLLVFIKGDPDKYTFHKPRVPQKYLNADPRAHKKNIMGRCLGNIFRIPAYRPPNVKAMNYHVAAYPEELVALMLESFTNPHDTVLDPFLGSGTTLKVCKTMKRNGIGFEINKDYSPLIESRIKERWEVPDWRSIDIVHSTTMETGILKPRKTHFQEEDSEEFSLFL